MIEIDGIAGEVMPDTRLRVVLASIARAWCEKRLHGGR
jgi:hypothetical protein